jgi:hypothetical protein
MVASRQDKTIAGILFAHSLLGGAWVLWTAAKLGFPLNFLVANLGLTGIGLFAAIGWSWRRRWAQILAAVFYAMQVPYVRTATVKFSFTLGLSAIVSFGWINGGAFGLNVFDLPMLLWVIYRFSRRRDLRLDR